MERIPTYTLADLSRAARPLHKAQKQHVYIFDIEKAARYSIVKDKQKSALDTAEKMYEKHQEWFDKKLQPLLPYIQREETRHTTDEAIAQRFKDGLQETVAFLSVNPYRRFDVQNFDLQDTVTAYTGSFIRMLRVCERFGANPDSALKLAQKSFKIEPATVIRLFEENSDLPIRAVERAALMQYTGRSAEGFLTDYRFLHNKRAARAANDQHNASLRDGRRWSLFSNKEPENAPAAPETITRPFRGDEYRGPRPRNGAYIEDVPTLRQKHVNWCGYTSLAMVLQYNGFTDITPEKLFRHEYGDYDAILESIDPSEGPSIETLALIAQELTPLKAHVLDKKSYALLSEKNPDLATPEDVLKSFLKKNVPCIVRFPKHFVVARGYDSERNFYIYNDPLPGLTIKSDKFELEWMTREFSEYQRDTQNLMMVLRPSRRK